jgi:hypothetical protein
MQRKIYLSQPDYTEKIIKTFQMVTYHPRATPDDSSVRLIKPLALRGQVEEEKARMTFPYREGIGSLLYLALVTRPNISFAFGLVDRFAENFDSSQSQAIRQKIFYLKCTNNYDICFNESEPRSTVESIDMRGGVPYTKRGGI